MSEGKVTTHTAQQRETTTITPGGAGLEESLLSVWLSHVVTARIAGVSVINIAVVVVIWNLIYSQHFFLVTRVITVPTIILTDQHAGVLDNCSGGIRQQIEQAEHSTAQHSTGCDNISSHDNVMRKGIIVKKLIDIVSE